MDEDASEGSGATADNMRIGDTVTWHGRRYVVLGMDPMGLPERRADLEDAETGELLQVPLAELEPARSAR